LKESIKRDFKGVWIPKEIWLDNNLTWIEKLLLTEIESLDNEEGCFASNNYFGKFFNMTSGRISQIIKSLIDKKYIIAQYEREGKQVKRRVLNILNRGIKYSKEGIKNIKQGYLGNAKENNTLINNTNNNIIKFKSSAELIIDLFNNITGKSLKHINSNFNMIIPRLKEGFTYEDFRKVFIVKYNQWKNNPEMKQYIRLSTLTRSSRFDDYLNEWQEPENIKHQKKEKDGIDLFEEWKQSGGNAK
jgi:uncharacterized phage protein (TIGR02220 family)